MIDLPKPGAYVVRTAQANNFSKNLVLNWLGFPAISPMKACLWLTASPNNEVQSLLEPYLLKRADATKGLDVVSVRDMVQKGCPTNSIRQLCRSLNTLSILQPTLVILEHAELWFNNSQEPLNKRNPMAQMQLLHRWAVHAHAHVITPVQGDLPEWSTFADGLADLNEQGEIEFRPWWPSYWGVQTNLWTENNLFTKLPAHLVLDSREFSNIKELAKTCHSLRFDEGHVNGIHVQAYSGVSAQDASMLLRMGADTVCLQPEKFETWLGISTDKIQNYPTLVGTKHTPENQFARDLHEAFMPGMLTVLSTAKFATQGLMMLQLANRWHMHCTLTRLSLMRHMNAQTAIRLVNWAKATCMVTATHEAIYLIKLWADEPNDASYREWLQTCFRESLPVLFGGDIQFIGQENQIEMLTDLHAELKPLSVSELIDSNLSEPNKVSEVWEGTPETLSPNRPWLHHMNQIFNGNPQ